jgi:hypothetical protein
MSTSGYLSHLDGRLGLPTGSLFKLCQKSTSKGVVENSSYKVTYRGRIERSKKASAGNFLLTGRKVFLIEGKRSKDGGRIFLAQISLPEDFTPE